MIKFFFTNVKSFSQYFYFSRNNFSYSLHIQSTSIIISVSYTHLDVYKRQVYDAANILGGYMDDLVYLNSPYHCLQHMPEDHPYMALYRRSHMYFCVGQGAWEDELLADTRKLDSVLKAKGIPAFVDYWGYDVSHDWCWWQKQAAYFLGKIL